MSMLLWALQILPTSTAAAAVSTKEPMRDSDFVWLITSCVMMPMKRMFIPSICKILYGVNSRVWVCLM